MTTRAAYYISRGGDEEAVRKAFRWFLGRSESKGFIAVPGLDNLDEMIKDVISQRVVRDLKNNKKSVVDNKEILLITERHLISDGKGLPIVAFWPRRNFLDELDSIPNISAILVVPWSMKEIEPWIKMWNATELGMQQVEGAGLKINKVVQAALHSLSSTVNKSTGIIHPRDRDAAVQMFTILRDSGERFIPEEVKAWLVVKEGWKAKHAQKVAEVAQQVLEGKRLKQGAPVWKKDILDIWRARAKEAEEE
jgi:hypothetical protein